MKRLIIPSIFLFLSAVAHARQTATTSDDEAQIRRVIESFHAALESGDKPRYLNLFLQGNVSWQSVMDEFQLSRELRKNPNAARAVVLAAGPDRARLENHRHRLLQETTAGFPARLTPVMWQNGSDADNRRRTPYG